MIARSSSHQMTKITGMRRIGRFISRFRQDRRAVVMVEFAYSLPVLVTLAFGATELANLAITNMRISQIALTISDNVSRSKQSVALSQPQLREVDINDAFIGAKIQGGSRINILSRGRIILSSLQRDSEGKQKIYWQRCKGMLKATPRYGIEGATEGKSGSFTGMGPADRVVKADPGSAIIFAEVTYDYEPLVGAWALGTFQLRREAAFYVRDERDLEGGPEANGIYNPSPAASKASCSVYNDSFT